MIREKKSWLTGILVFALLCTLLLVVPQEHAMAASKKVPAFDKTKQIVFVGDEDSYVDSIKFVNVSSKAKVTNIKFSNLYGREYTYYIEMSSTIFSHQQRKHSLLLFVSF